LPDPARTYATSHVGDVHQAQVGFVNESRRLESLSRFLPGQLLGSQLAQFVVDKGQQLFRGLQIGMGVSSVEGARPWPAWPRGVADGMKPPCIKKFAQRACHIWCVCLVLQHIREKTSEYVAGSWKSLRVIASVAISDTRQSARLMRIPR
jgi:hypothetical protein